MLGDFNARLGNEVIEGIVGQHGVIGRNESGERFLNMCGEQELVVGNSCIKKKDVYKYTWLRMAEGGVVDRAFMDYVLLPKQKLGSLLDVRVTNTILLPFCYQHPFGHTELIHSFRMPKPSQYSPSCSTR